MRARSLLLCFALLGCTPHGAGGDAASNKPFPDTSAQVTSLRQSGIVWSDGEIRAFYLRRVAAIAPADEQWKKERLPAVERAHQAFQMRRDALVASGWALLLMALTFPPFALGYRFYWRPHAHFALRLPAAIFDEIAGQLVVIALPEEAFFRGYLQTSLDRVWPPRWRVLGADLGPGWLVAAAIFALGHVLTIRHPARLAVFFPALVFGWLRRRTGGIGASVLFHASCNVFSATLGRGLGLM